MASYRPITQEIAAPTTNGTATTVSGADIVRVTDTSGNHHVLTVLDSNDNIIGSMTLGKGEVFILKKRESDKIFASNSNVRLTRITYPVM